MINRPKIPDTDTRRLLDEAIEQHRKIKRTLLDIMERINVPNTTKQKIGDQLFLLYQDIK